MKRKAIIRGIIGVLVIAALFGYFYMRWLNKPRVFEEVTVELGSAEIDVKAFLIDSTVPAMFVGELGHVNLDESGNYPVQIKAGPTVYTSNLRVVDTTSPIMELKELSLGLHAEIEPADFVVSLVDLSPVELSFQSVPDTRRTGRQVIEIIARDSSGNTIQQTTHLNIANVRSRVIIELGTRREVTLKDFVIGDNLNIASFKSDLGSIDFTIAGQYDVELDFLGVRVQVPLIIQDTIAPTGVAVEQSGFIGSRFEAADFVMNVEDRSETTIYFKTIPDLKRIGRQEVIIAIRDSSANETEIRSAVTLEMDPTGPVITGVRDFFVDSSTPIGWLNGVSAYDAADGYVNVGVDASQVNLNREGTYRVIYTARDSDGHVTNQEASVVVDFVTPYSPRGSTGSGEVDSLADGILSRLINGDMSNSQIMSSVYSWVVGNLSYSSPANTNFHIGATEGLRFRRGNCYTQAYTAQALLLRAGISAGSNVEYAGRHAWCTVGGYIIDPTMQRYMVSEAAAQDIVFNGVYIYRTVYSDPPKAERVLKDEHRNPRPIPYQTVYELNPDINTTYPNQTIKQAGVVGKVVELWNVEYVDGKIVYQYAVTTDYVVTPSKDEIVLVGRRYVTTESIPTTVGTTIVLTGDSTLDGKPVPETGSAGLVEIVKLITSIDSNGKPTAFSDPTRLVKIAMIPQSVYQYQAPVITEVERSEVLPAPAGTETVTTPLPELDGTRVPDTGSDGLKSWIEIITTNFDGQTTSVIKDGSLSVIEPIPYKIYRYVAPETGS